MTANHTTKKTADVLAHVDGTASTNPEETMDQHTESQAFELRIEDYGSSSRYAFATLSGAKLPMRGYMRVIVPREAVRAACAAPSQFIVSDGDVAEHNRRLRATKAKEEHRRRQQQRLLDMEERIAAAADSLRINATDDDIVHAAAAALSVLGRNEHGTGK